MQYGFYFDQTRCIGCYACVIACKDWHTVREGQPAMCKITTIEKGKFPDVFLAFVFSACYHCAHPACVQACPAGAITKRKIDGIVIVDGEKCLGEDACEGACKKACVYDAPVFGTEENAKMQKCNFCLDRVSDGLNPVCVDACRTRALDAGPIDKVKAKYGGAKEAVGFSYFAKRKPSIIFRTKGIGDDA
jgi:anaerobic dimethyl sulfoxide reductase subunit B (iron-sulfur subunit)